MKTLYVHVGLPKTGTSAIQAFCVENRELLEKKGFCYPNLPYRYEGKSSSRNGAFLTAKLMDKNGVWLEEKEKQRFAEGLGKVKELFQTFDNVILSDEGIWLNVKSRRKTLFEELKDAGSRDGYITKIIVYLRRQDEYISSIWNQKVKHKEEERSWEEFLDVVKQGRLANLKYYRTLKQAAESLGMEHIIVRRYGREYLKGGMSQMDFLDALGLEFTDEYKMDHPTVNQKLTLNGVEIKRVINGFDTISAAEKSYLGQVLSDITSISGQTDTSVMWSAQQAKAFVDQFKKENKKIANTFIQDGKPLFRDHFQDGAVWKKDNPSMQDDLIRFMVMSNVALLRQIQQLQKAVDGRGKSIAASGQPEVKRSIKSFFHKK